MMQIFTGAPIWVWPLLAVLVFVGLRARRSRTVSVWLVYALPLLGIMSLRAVQALPADGMIWGVFLLAYAAGGWGGYVVQRGLILGQEGRRVRLAGEWLTLGVMMVIFWANFGGGVMRAVAPAAYGDTMFMSVFTALLAVCGGSFAGRALRVWQGRRRD